MTVAPHDIDPARLLEEHLAQASPGSLPILRPSGEGVRPPTT